MVLSRAGPSSKTKAGTASMAAHSGEYMASMTVDNGGWG